MPEGPEVPYRSRFSLEARAAYLEARNAALEEENAYFRAVFGWMLRASWDETRRKVCWLVNVLFVGVALVVLIITCLQLVMLALQACLYLVLALFMTASQFLSPYGPLFYPAPDFTSYGSVHYDAGPPAGLVHPPRFD